MQSSRYFEYEAGLGCSSGSEHLVHSKPQHHQRATEQRRRCGVNYNHSEARCLAVHQRGGRCQAVIKQLRGSTYSVGVDDFANGDVDNRLSEGD